MLKQDEILDPNSCLNRAIPEERMFVLLARDEVAPHTIRQWVSYRITLGKNQMDDPEIREALQCADQMEAERPRIRNMLGK